MKATSLAVAPPHCWLSGLTPAAWMTRTMRSMLTRTFCWRSVTSELCMYAFCACSIRRRMPATIRAPTASPTAISTIVIPD